MGSKLRWATALGMVGALGLTGVTLASGIERRLVKASDHTWQASYTNEGPFPQRVVLHAEGDWSYEPRSACAMAGVPWSKALREQASSLVDPDCPPWSLLGRVKTGADEAGAPFCVVDKDHFVLPSGGTLTFAINELGEGYADNTGALRLEIVALDLTPAMVRPDHDDGVALDLGGHQGP